MDNKLEKLLSDLRKFAAQNVSTKNKKIPDNENIALSPYNNIYDIDIFFSRKPGMRSSVQIVGSDCTNKMFTKLSCLTALASLCDTIVNNKDLNVTEQDIATFMAEWMKAHNIVNK